MQEPEKRAELTKSIESSILGGNPWVFRDAIRFGADVRDGDVVRLVDRQGKFVARGTAEVTSDLPFRAWTLDEKEPVDEVMLERRLTSAVELRKRVIAPDTNAYRMCHGENDHLPGMHVDWYDGIASLRLDGVIGREWEKKYLRVVRRVLNPRAIVTRNHLVAGGDARIAFGEVPAEMEIIESGRVYFVDVLRGQKTGFFLDQRENRDLIQQISRGLRVANLFSYTGGFSLAAALGGANSVLTVDLAAPAVETASRAFTRNGIDPAKHEFIARDAFEVLDDLNARKIRQPDLLIVDPPSFIRNKSQWDRGIRAYQKVNELALRVLPVGGILCSASCSSHLRMPDFLKMLAAAAKSAGRELTVFATRGAGIDHPLRFGFPEGEYLKFVAAYVTK